MVTEEDFSKVLERYGKNLKKVHYDIPINGSPERSAFRVVVEDDNDEKFILENIKTDTKDRKQEIIDCLSKLKGNGLSSSIYYLKSKDGKEIVESMSLFWQLQPFVDGIDLIRPNYIFEEWRGVALSNFLQDMWSASEKASINEGEVYSILDYVDEISAIIKEHKPEVYLQIDPVIEFLKKDFYKVHDTFPVKFCHGDYHPINAIWGDRKINSVIDWEFMGRKPEIYDIANMMGCIGIEDPRSFFSGLANAFVIDLKESKEISDKSWEYLPEFILALRFAWLSEWLRKKDDEMIDLEIAYMKLIMDNLAKLKELFTL